MNEKTRVKSYIRKGKIVRSFDRKGKKRKKIILGSLGALGAIGLASAGGLLLKKNLGSNIIKSPVNKLSQATILPSTASIGNVTTLSSNIISPLPNTITSQASVISAKNISNTIQPTNLPKTLKRTKKNPVLSSNKVEPKVISNTQKFSTIYQSNDEIENRIVSRIPKQYKFPSNNNPHNLSKAEQYSISEYSSWSYQEINGTLRGLSTNKQLQKNLQDEVNAIRSGLNKMPSTDSPIVYRGVKLYDDKKLNTLYDQYEIGKELVEPGFLSTSTKDLQEFGKKLRYEIIPKPKVSQGKNISDYSTARDEAEVLFPPNTTFKVIDKFIKGNTKWIRMEEL